MKNSSAIRIAIRDGKNLTVTFQTGDTYTYRGVPPNIVEDLFKADSVGSFFYKNIRNTFPYEKL